MRKYKQILEAINRGIQFALDDFDPEEVELSKPKQETITKEDSLYQNLKLREYVVDLGLPSGTLWCKYNLGCDYDLLNNHPKQAKPEDWYGGYYAWGEIIPNKHLIPKCNGEQKKYEGYTWGNYKYSSLDVEGAINKYCSNKNYGYKNFTDNLTQLLPEDDAAYQNMHIGNFKFHMPTKKQFEELLEYTTSISVTNYCINDGLTITDLPGRLFIGRNGNKLFFPYTGYFIDSDFHSNLLVYKCGKISWLLSSDLYIDNPDGSYNLYISKDKTEIKYCRRNRGVPIRPVISLK